MRILLFLLALITLNFYGCGNADNNKKEHEEQQEFQQRPDYSKDTLSV